MPSINLQNDAADIHEMFADAVQKYVANHKTPATSKKHGLVTRIDLNFALGDSVSTPLVTLSFDTKPGSEPDGDPTHDEFATLDRPDWLAAVQAVCNGEDVTVIQADCTTTICASSELTQTLGQFMVDILLDARKSGTLTALPKAERCELGVEDSMNGEFGWPFYTDRGKNNLVT